MILKEGFLLVDKPAGPTAHDVVDSVRRSLNTRRVGHTGTLDPFATGLLVVLVGRATRLSQFLVGLPKKYTGTIRLGVSTDTHDLTGDVLEENLDWQTVTRESIDREVDALVGRYEQRPPKYSAKKVGGRRAYKLAREGEEVHLPSKEIEVFDFLVSEISGADLTFRCDVSSGTYVRAMARDLGEALGCGAHLSSLRRLTVGGFLIEQAQDLSDISETTVSMGSPAEAVGHLPRFVIESEDSRRKITHGQPIPAPEGDDSIVAMVADEELVAIAERRDGMFKPRVVMEG